MGCAQLCFVVLARATGAAWQVVEFAAYLEQMGRLIMPGLGGHSQPVSWSDQALAEAPPPPCMEECGSLAESGRAFHLE